MAVLEFKFDESYDEQIMSVGGWIGNKLEWKKLETRWQRRVDFQNAHSAPNQQIIRFHATRMNGNHKEYKHWDKPMSFLFTQKLIGLLAKRKMGAIGVACDMDAIRQVFPRGDEASLKRRTYVLCAKQLMIDIAHVLQDYFPGDHVLLVHDHGNWDEELLHGYNLMIDDPAWEPRRLFEGLLPMTSEKCIGLQAADLIAYEVFKGVKTKTNNPERAMRGATQAMLSKDIPMSARWINLPSAKAIYQVMQDSGKYPELDHGGLT